MQELDEYKDGFKKFVEIVNNVLAENQLDLNDKSSDQIIENRKVTVTSKNLLDKVIDQLIFNKQTIINEQ